MKKYAFILFILTFAIGKSVAQPNIDPEKLDPMQQVLNASIQVIDPIKKPADAKNYEQLIPQFSAFVLSQIDSFDLYYHKADTIYYQVYAQNEEYIGNCQFKVFFLKGKKTLALNPSITKKEHTTTDIDFKQFNYNLAVKSVLLPDPHKKSRNIAWTRYIIQKQYIKPQERTQYQSQKSILEKKDQPFIFQMNK